MADDRPNLWVTPQPNAETAPAPEDVSQISAQQALGPAVSPPLPVQRQVGSVQAPQVQLGTQPMPPAEGVLWWALGVHGGAGVSTLLRTVGGGGDANRRWPDIHGAVSGVHIVLVARADARGLAAAQAALQEWHSGQAPASTNIVGLVLMADAPTKPPRSVRDRIRVLTGAVGQFWQVPWVEEWREGGKARKRVKELEALEQTLLQLPLPHIQLALPPGPSARAADAALGDVPGAVAAEPQVARMPEPMIAPMPEPVVVLAPEPAVVLVPEPVVAPVPEPAIVLAPEPAVVLVPEPEVARVAEPLMAHAGGSRPGPVAMPGPVVAPAPGPGDVHAEAPASVQPSAQPAAAVVQASTPAPVPAPAPGPAMASAPGPAVVQATEPEPAQPVAPVQAAQAAPAPAPARTAAPAPKPAPLQGVPAVAQPPKPDPRNPYLQPAPPRPEWQRPPSAGEEAELPPPDPATRLGS
ncbi:hypothetical protein FHS39_001085 [Streptomyces olivoverticillatus]|uniref:Uncharacterized protein n=1 Tax=Streptomyces olivoverticillatus TaxID=66427 RepID=A0A7W7PKT7_9ACTN|nr:hypothetical protein [Streptomyces olivoverticillatus]MBB4892085.1 hypothetical protein [Streptomyces olivoverticillatus]